MLLSYKLMKTGPKSAWAVEFGAAYLRFDSQGKLTGHCVVMYPEEGIYVCFQKDPNGRNVTHEVNEAVKVVVFGIWKTPVLR